MGRTKAYEKTLKAIAQVKQGIGNFELFLRKAIAESEGEPTCSPEACNDPDNCVRRKTATAGDIYQSCVEFAEKKTLIKLNKQLPFTCVYTPILGGFYSPLNFYP